MIKSVVILIKKMLSAYFTANLSLMLKHNIKFIKKAAYTSLSDVFPYLVIANQTEKLLINTRDQVIGRSIFLDKEFDFHKFELAIILIDPEISKKATLIDVGANIGTICIPAISRHLVSSAIAIEPDPDNAALLRANIALNKLEYSIHVVEAAASSDSNNRLALSHNPENHGDHRVCDATKNTNLTTVNCVTLDQIIQMHALDPNEIIIWMDIQGHEPLALVGAKDILAHRPKLIVEYWPSLLDKNCTHNLFMDCIKHYDQFIDLGAETPVPLPLDELSLLKLALARTENFTDILLF